MARTVVPPPRDREELLQRLQQATALIQSVLSPGVLDTKETTCTVCPHGAHPVRSNLTEYKAKTELSGVVNKLEKWSQLLKGEQQMKEGSEEDGHQ